MAIAVTLDSSEGGRDVMGDRAIRRGSLKLNTYATNGIAVLKTDLGYDHSLVDLEVRPSAGYVIEFVPTTAGQPTLGGKLKAFWSAASGSAMSEVTNNTDLSAISFRFRAEGK